MKILLLPSYFTPEQFASSYLQENCNQAYVDEGFDMIVYAPMPCRGISDEVRNIYKGLSYEKSYDGKMVVHRFRLMKEGRNTYQRALRYIIMCVKQVCLSLFSKDAKNCDLLFVSSTPPIQGAMAALIKKIRKIPLVYNLQDIFPDSMVSTGMTQKGSLLWKLGRRIEDFTYRNSDKIIVISNDFKKNIMAKGVPENKIEIIYNWVDEKAVVEIPRERNILFDRYNLNRKDFYITYSGNIGHTQNLDMLIDVAEILDKRYKDIKFVLIGEGAYKKSLEEKVNTKNINNIILLPFQPYEEISHVFSLGDAGLVISKPGVGTNSVPSKTWSIMSASKPVLANFDENELKEIIEANNCGIFTKAGDIDGFVTSILTLYDNRDLSKRLGKNGRKFIISNLTKEIGTKKFVEVVKNLTIF